MDTKIIKQPPPDSKWMGFPENKPKFSGRQYKVFGLVNVGTEHECFETFIAKWDKEIGWMNRFGDQHTASITHFQIDLYFSEA